MTELFKIIKEIYDSTYVPRVNYTELSEDLIRTRVTISNLFNITVTMI